MFKRKLRETEKEMDILDATEERFQKMVDLVWDLDKKDFNRMIEALKLVWQGYDKMRPIQTIEEKTARVESTDDEMDGFLDMEAIK